LNSGSHTIIIQDANGCTDAETIIIDEPLVATPAITALPTCANNDGIITMTELEELVWNYILLVQWQAQLPAT
jgi:hypothetical protein